MIGIAIRFDLGRYHANPWGSHVNEAATEWPPSPWRLIRALYSTARTNVSLTDQQAAIDRALQALVTAPHPMFVLPPAASAHTRHYMPLSSYSSLRQANTSKVLDGFIAIDPKSELTVWWDVTLDAKANDALSEVVRRLGYLGRSESVCSARMVTGSGPERVSAAPAGTAGAQEDWEMVELLCPRRDQPLDTLTVSVAELRKGRHLRPAGTEHVTYAVAPTEPATSRKPTKTSRATPTLALLRLQGSQRPAVTEAVAVGQALRSALQHVYGARNEGTASSTFSGRRGDEPRDDQHRHAHYLALPETGTRRVDRLVVWAPEGLRPSEVEALAGVTYLSMHSTPDRMPIALAALATEHDLKLDELTGTVYSWHSATPFGLIRHPKRRQGEIVDSPIDQVRRELTRRGFPEPIEVSLEPGSWHRFRSHKTGLSRHQRARVFGVRLRFAEEIHGPIAIGALSHYGLGLFTPDQST